MFGSALCAALLCPTVLASPHPADTLAGTIPPPLTAARRVDSLPATGESKSVATAMFLSAVLPGAGQLYNESYWKVPVVVGLGTYFLAEFLNNNKKLNQYSDLYEASLAITPGGNSQLLTYREFYRDQRDTFAWYFLILYAVNILDAFVDASLFDFDVGGDLAGAAHGPPSPGASLTLRVRM